MIGRVSPAIQKEFELELVSKPDLGPVNRVVDAVLAGLAADPPPAP